MCSNPAEFLSTGKDQLYSFDEIIARLDKRAKQLRKTNETIYLTGGEPSIHPDFIKLLKWIRKKFPQNEICCVSNARMFSYPGLAQEVLRFPNLKLELSFHGHTPSLYGRITGSPAYFYQAFKGIKEVLKYRNRNQYVELRTVLLKQNYKRLNSLLSFIHNNFKGLNSVILIFPELEGQAADNLKKIFLSYEKIRPVLSPILKKWNKKIPDLRIYHFPLCVVDPELWPNTWRTLPAEEIDFPPICENCAHRPFCMGIHKDYLRLIGDKEFHPPRGKIDLRLNKGEEFIYHPIISARKID
jgi:MoaA/NifB/PqqE/SkfB family radical SAM enzyme